MTKTKICKKCEKKKLAINFYIDKRTNGLFSRCKKCCKEAAAIRQKENVESQRASTLNNYRKNKESYNKRSKEWYYKNLEKGKSISRNSMQKGRDDLSDNYIKMVIQRSIKKSEDILITHAEIPDLIVQLKRKQLKLIRQNGNSKENI